MIRDLSGIAFNNLKRRKLRSWLTMMGIFIGISAVIALISLGQGLQTAITGQFSTLSTDKLTIQNSETGFGPPGSTVVKKLNDHDLKVVERVRGVENAVPRLIRVVKVEFNKAAIFNYIGDIPEDEEDREMVYGAGEFKAKKGRLLRSTDKGKIVIGSNIAKKSTFDEEIQIGKKLKVQGKEFEVVGILGKGSSFMINDVILMLNSDMKSMLNIGDEIDLIVAQIRADENPEEVGKRIEKSLRNDRNLKEGEEDFSVQTPLQAISSINQVLIVINIIVVGIALVSIFVGGIGVANTMYTSVLERRKEIGTMKAIGAKNSDILIIFLIESGLLGLVGGLIGVLIGAALALGLSSAANNYFGIEIIRVNLSWILMISVLISSFLLGILFGALPSYQASKLRPVDALKG